MIEFRNLYVTAAFCPYYAAAENRMHLFLRGTASRKSVKLTGRGMHSVDAYDHAPGF